MNRDPTTDNLAIYNRLNEKFSKKLVKYYASVAKVIESGNQAKLYKLLSRWLKRNNRITSLVSDDGERVLNERDMADLLADHFYKVYSRTVESFPGNTFANSPEFPVMDDSAWLPSSQILRILSKSTTTSSTNPDQLTSTFTKKVAPYIPFPLELIYNYSFVHADVPARWRHVYIIPISKSSASHLPSN